MVFLIFERMWFAVASDRAQSKMRSDHWDQMSQQFQNFYQLLKDQEKNHSETCDRLQARSLSEHKSWQAPVAPEVKAEEFDADWDRPSFRLPEGTTG